MAYIDKYGVEYSDDKTTLVSCPRNFSGAYIVPDSVYNIQENAFWGCNKVTSIRLPSRLTAIEKGTFCGCSLLKHIEIPFSVWYISEDAFRACFELTEVVFQKIENEKPFLYSIGKAAFANCESLVRIDIPKGVSSLGVSVFAGCEQLSHLSLPDSIEEIGAGAIENCNLTSVTSSIIKSLTEIIVPIGHKQRFLEMFGQYSIDLSPLIIEK